MTSFFRFFIQRHVFALLLTVFIIILGLLTLPNINRNTFPDVDLDEVVIRTQYPGASPKDIELKITNKIETKLKSIDGIKQYSSVSMENSSIIRVVIEADFPDPDKVHMDIREGIDSIATFPSDLENKPSVTKIDTGVFPVLEVGLVSETLDYPRLRAISKEFKDTIESMNGINRLYTYGYLAKEIQILPIPEKLDEYQISLLQIISTIANRNVRSSMGNLSENNMNKTIVNDSQLFNISDLRNAIIRSNFNGQSVRIGDVSVVKEGFEDETVISKLLGYRGTSFNIIKSQNADILTINDKINEVIKSFELKYPEITFVTANDFSKYLRNRLSVMTSNGIIGLSLVILVLAFFLNFRMAFWVSLGIPVAIMGVFFLMPTFNMTINIISLLALIIVIGIIVDDGIIIAENIAKYQEAGHAPEDASVLGIQGVFKPVLTTIFTTIVAFSPMFFMTGIMGKFIYQIPLVITLALFISLIEVVIALPSHIAAASRPKLENTQIPRRHQFVNALRLKYERVLRICLLNKYKLVLGFAIVFIASILFSKYFMNFVLFPESSAVQFFVRVEASAGTSLEEMSKSIQPIEEEILKLPKNELQAFTTRLGMTGDGWMMFEQENVGFIIVDLVPFTGRDRSAREVMADIKSKTKNVPGFKEITYQVESGGPPVGKALSVEVIINDDARRDQVTTEIMNYVKYNTESMNGVVSIERNDLVQKGQISIAFNYELISRLGLDIASIQSTIRTAFSGAIASTIRRGDEDVNFMVKFADLDTNKIENLKNLRIPNALGRLISLKDIANFESTDGAPNYFHYDGKRSTTITGDLDKKIITSTKIAKMIKEKFSGPEYSDVLLIFGGEAEETNKSVQGLIRSFLAALIGIFFLLVLLFNSFTQPFLVILTVPFGLIGVIIAFALHGQDLGFISMVGVVGLTGVVVNDSLVMINHTNTLIKERSESETIFDMVLKGGSNRFRPILITSFTTVAGLLPLAYGLGGEDPFIAPMALAIGYGLLFSTPLTLFLLPSLQLIFNDIRQYIDRKRA